MVVTVQLYEGTTFIPTTGQLYSDIQTIINEAVDFEPEYCLLIHGAYSITYKGKTFSRSWLSTVLLLLPIPNTLTYTSDPDTLQSYESFLQDGEIYVKLDPIDNYSEAHSQLYLATLDTLLDLYNRGSILLDPTLDRDFIRSWDLLANPLYRIEVAGRVDTDRRRLYHPRWRNTWITINPNNFLTSPSPTTFTIGDNNVNRHFISRKLTRNQIEHAFLANQVVIWANSIHELELAHQKVISATTASKGQIKIVYRDYEDLETVT